MPFTYFTDEQKFRAKQDALNNIKFKTVRNGQRVTARWAIKQEISQSHELVKEPHFSNNFIEKRGLSYSESLAI